MNEHTAKTAAKAAGLISFMFFISRVLGFVRESLSGSLFSRFETDSYIAAFVIPDTMYYLLVGGALSAAFIPVFTEYLSKGEEEEGWKMTSTFINILGLILLTLTVLGVTFTRFITPIEAPNFSGAKLQLLIQLTRVMFPAVFFTALAGLMGGILNSYHQFFGPAFGPNVYNMVIIIVAILLGSRLGIKGMAIGVLIGAIGNFLTQMLFLKNTGKSHYFRFGYIDLQNPGFKKMLLLWLPALIGLSADQVNIWATTAMASSQPEGAITAIRFATRLIQLPIGIFAAGISMAYFPLLSGLVAEKKMDTYKDTLSLALRSIFFVMIPSAIGLIALRYPIVKLLFERHKFTPKDTDLTAYALQFYSLALFAHAAILMLPRAFYALQDTKTPVFVGIGSVSLSILLNWIFIHYTQLGVAGFALSFTAMGLVNMFALTEILRKRVKGIRGRKIFRSYMLCLFASLIMGFFIKFTQSGVIMIGKSIGLVGHSLAAIEVLLGLAVGGGVFIGLTWLFKMEELQIFLNLLKVRFLKKRAA